MRAEGVADLAIRNFEHYYGLLEAGEAGMLAESEIEPVESVPDADDLPDGGDAARDALDRTVVLKLNGGLGTSMGMTQAKSLLEAKDGLSFIDVIARQVLEVRKRSGARLPLVLMNSFYTRDDTLDGARALPRPAGGCPARLRAGQGPEDRRRRPVARVLARRPRPRVGAAGPRRPLHVARHVGDARRAARARLRVRVRGERRQPRRDPRRAHPRLVRARAAAVPDGGGRPHRGRSQGRAPRPAARAAGSCCARSRRPRTTTSTRSRT